MVLGVAIVLTWIGDLAKDLVPIASLLGVLTMGLVILEKAESLGQIIASKLQRLGSLPNSCSSCWWGPR